MFALYRTLSGRYLRQRWSRAALIVAIIALGVAMLVATLSLSETMDKAVRAAVNPLAGGADLQVSHGNSPIDLHLRDELTQVRGVQSVRPLLLGSVRLPDLKEGKERTVLLVGVELFSAVATNPWGVKPVIWDPLKAGQARLMSGEKQCLVGEELNRELDEHFPNRSTPLRVQAAKQRKPFLLTRVGTVDAQGPAAALGGNLLATDLATAAEVLGQKAAAVAAGHIRVTRLDLVLKPGFDRDSVRGRVRRRLEALHERAEVTTPQERDQTSQKNMAGLQTGFHLSGLGALVVGMFLVFLALSVSVAERRHEIGILRALGATRGQVRRLFAGEAAVLGLAGALIGVPLGLGLAYIALEPMKEVVSDIFRTMEAKRVEWTVGTAIIAGGAGLVTALLAALVPAFKASWEEPAVAVRRVPPNPTWSYRLVQLAASLGLLAIGFGLIVWRDELPRRQGTYGGMFLVLVGALLATPLLAAVAARVVQLPARHLLGIEGRLAADNLLRAPTRTGLVIAALAAGVMLVLQTAGTTRSNRDAVTDWVRRYITADLIVSTGSPVSPQGNQLVEKELAEEMRQLASRAIKAVVPVRSRYLPYRDKDVLLVTLDAEQFYQADLGHVREVPGLSLYRQLSREPGTALVSENFAALYGVSDNDTIDLGGVRLRVLGKFVDYQWNGGTIVMDQRDYLRQFRDGDTRVTQFDVYLRPGADAGAVQTRINRRFGADKGLLVTTHAQYQALTESFIDRLYGIAYGQQLVVGIVAALGVVAALMISILQRRRELGVLRAVGASRAQVVRSVLAEAALMGLIGTAIGVLIGIPLEWYILKVVILEETGYLFPMTIPWAEGGIIAALALFTATVAGLGPALHAVRIPIPEAIAHE